MSLSKGPYENHYYALGEPIRNIVKQGQELLCSMNTGLNRRALSDYWVFYPGFHGGDTSQYPQSLGELCIEIAQDTMRQITIEYNTPPGFWGTWPTDLQALRELLYHKRTQ